LDQSFPSWEVTDVERCGKLDEVDHKLITEIQESPEKKHLD